MSPKRHKPQRKGRPGERDVSHKLALKSYKLDPEEERKWYLERGLRPPHDVSGKGQKPQ